MSEFITHYNPEMDDKLFDATEPAVERLLNQHHEGFKPWYPSDLISKDLIHDATNPKNQESLRLPEGVNAAIVTFLITEDGLPFYHQTIANALAVKPNSAWADWPSTWTSEEKQHEIAGERIVLITDVDEHEVTDLQRGFLSHGDTPQMPNAARTSAYAALQESNTETPYRALIKELSKLRTEAKAQDEELRVQILSGVIDTYGRVAHDESRHRRFYAGAVQAAFDSGDPEIMSYQLAAVLDEFKDFRMPGQEGIPGFARRAVKIMRQGIFTRIHVAQQKRKLLVDTWNVEALENLTGKGREAQEKLGAMIEDLDKQLAT